MRFYLPRSRNFGRVRGNGYPAQDHAHKESDGPMFHQPNLRVMWPARLLKGGKVNKPRDHNHMAIAGGLIASKVPAFHDEWASIGSLEFEAT